MRRVPAVADDYCRTWDLCDVSPKSIGAALSLQQSITSAVSSMKPLDLVGKTVVVTGGSRGIGLQLVKQFLGKGSKVIATSRKPEEAVYLKELSSQHPGLVASQLDTGDAGNIRTWAAHLQDHCHHVDILVNNAGIYGRRLPLLELEPSDFLSTFTTNALGPFLVVQALHHNGLLGGSMGKSVVVNISSIMSSHGDETVSSVTPGGYAYRASKAALNIINKAFSMDLGSQGVDCVLVHPGYVRTDLTGGNGWINADESAAGIIAILERGAQLNGRFYSYNGQEIPW